jgi:hypothetical protein
VDVLENSVHMSGQKDLQPSLRLASLIPRFSIGFSQLLKVCTPASTLLLIYLQQDLLSLLLDSFQREVWKRDPSIVAAIRWLVGNPCPNREELEGGLVLDCQESCVPRLVGANWPKDPRSGRQCLKSDHHQ